MSILILVGTEPVQRRYAHNRVTDLLLTSQLLSHAPAPRGGQPGQFLPPPEPRTQQGALRSRATNMPNDQLGTGPDRPRRNPDRQPFNRGPGPPSQENGLRRGLSPLQVVPEEELTFLLQEQAETHDVRILLVRPNTGEVHFDSVIERGEESQSHRWRSARYREQMVTGEELGLPERAQRLLPVVFTGSTEFDGKNWLYASTRLEPDKQETSLLMVVMAPRFNGYRAIRETSKAFHIHLLLIAFLLLVLLTALFSIWLTRLITKGLQPLFQATREIGGGNLDYRIPDDLHMPQEFIALTKEFNEMGEQTQRQQQALRDFVANAGHELKTPLTSIIGFLQAIIDGTAVGPMQQRAIEISYEEAGRLQERIDRLLDLARLENPNRKLDLQLIDLNEQLQALVEQFEHRSQTEEIELIWQPSGKPCMIKIDSDDLHRIFSNLLDNAFTHMQTDGQITLTTRHHQGENSSYIEAIVEDNGSGIPAQDLPNIFERFYQVDKAKSKTNRGTGLGLSIVKELVESHSGTVGVESAVGMGSRFWVRFDKF